MCISEEEFAKVKVSVEKLQKSQEEYREERREYSEHLKTKFDAFQAEISKLVKMLTGNGKIEEGLLYIVKTTADGLREHLEGHKSNKKRGGDIVDDIIKYVITLVLGILIARLWTP